jgi:hypothetical protein
MEMPSFTNPYLRELARALGELKRSVTMWERVAPSEPFASGVSNADQRQWMNAAELVELWFSTVLTYVNDILEDIVFARMRQSESEDAASHFMDFMESGASQSLFSEWLVQRVRKFDVLSQEELASLLEAHQLRQEWFGEISSSFEVIKRKVEFFEALQHRLEKLWQSTATHDTGVQ